MSHKYHTITEWEKQQFFKVKTPLPMAKAQSNRKQNIPSPPTAQRSRYGPGKKGRQDTEDEIFRHIDKIIHDEGVPKPGVMHVKLPYQREIRDPEKIVDEKAYDRGKEQPAKGGCALSFDNSRGKSRGGKPEDITEREVEHVGKAATARKYREPRKPHKNIHRNRSRPPSGAEQQSCKHSHDRLKRQRHQRERDLYVCRYDHQNDEQRTFRKADRNPLLAAIFLNIFSIYV